MKTVVLALCVFACLATEAADVFCKANGTKIQNAACWGDNLAPHDDAAYVIASNYMASVDADAIFGGKSLQVGSLPYASSKDIGKLRSLGSGTHRMEFPREGLKLAAGDFYVYYQNAIVEVHGIVTVLSGANRPFVIRNDNYRNSNGFVFKDPFKGSAGAVVEFTAWTNNFSVTLNGDCSEYFGTINANTRSYPDGRKFPHYFKVGATEIPGKLALANGVTLSSSATNDFTVGELTLAKGSTLVVDRDAERATNSVVRVTGKFSAPDGGVKLKLNIGNIDRHFRLHILDVPDSSELSDEDFELADSGTYLTSPDLYMDSVSVPGRKILVAEYFPVVTMVKNDNSLTIPEKDPDKNSKYSSAVAAMTNGTYWSDGQIPHSNAHYVVRSIAKATALHMPYTTAATNMVFPGRSLTIGQDVNLFLPNGSFNTRELHLENGAVVWNSKSSSCDVLCPLVCEAGTVDIKVWSWGSINILGPVAGAALIRSGGGTDTSTPSGAVVLAGDGSGFGGKWQITLNKAYAAGYYQHLLLASGGSLGRPLDGYVYNALALDDDALLGVADSATQVSLDDQTRGVYISGSAQFKAAQGQRLSINSPVAFNGTATKVGNGRLEFGGSVKFGADGANVDPGADKSRQTLKIAAGSLKVSACDSLNGVDVVLSGENSRIAVDAGTGNEELAAYGFRNTKSDTPFVSCVGDGKIVFEVEGSELVTPRRIALCTVSDAAAAQLEGKIRAVRSPSLSGRNGRPSLFVSKFSNGGTTTFVCDIKVVGFSLIVR